jgi:hypothetical protein
MHCVDLRTLGRYRLWNEVENRPARKADDPWDLIIPGTNGFVAPWSDQRLVVATNSRKMTDRILESVPRCEVVQNGSDGQNITFDPEGLPIVARLLRLRKKRGWAQAGNGKIPAFIVGTATRQGVRTASDDSQAT